MRYWVILIKSSFQNEANDDPLLVILSDLRLLGERYDCCLQLSEELLLRRSKFVAASPKAAMNTSYRETDLGL